MRILTNYILVLCMENYALIGTSYTYEYPLRNIACRRFTNSVFILERGYSFIKLLSQIIILSLLIVTRLIL